MKKITTLTFVICAVLLACNKNKKAENPEPAPTEITVDSVIPAQPHTAKNSLDYLGIYKGKLPCADCSGIETSLQLGEDFSYTLTRKYLGKSNKIIEQKGTYSWNKAGNAIILDNAKDEPNQYFVGENALTQLDMAGKKIGGKLAQNYILKKMTEAQAAKTDAAPEAIKAFDITSVQWKLAELNGKAVKNKEGQKEFSIRFKADNNFSAFAGCNQMAGHYEIAKSKIKFLRIMATMMACADMKPEDQLKTALETADNYVANEKVLQLRSGGNTLAKFEAQPLKSK